MRRCRDFKPAHRSSVNEFAKIPTHDEDSLIYRVAENRLSIIILPVLSRRPVISVRRHHSIKSRHRLLEKSTS